MVAKFKAFGLPILLCLTLGLAPYLPEPHLLSKLKWIFGGGKGMLAIDWFDFLLHGFPWVYLLYKIFKKR